MKQARHLLLFLLCCLGSLALTAQCYNADGSGTPIPLEGTGGGPYPDTRQSFDFVIEDEGVIGEDVEIQSLQLFIEHTFVGDLLLILRNPDGVESVITGGTGNDNQGYAGYIYADSASIPTEGGVIGTDALTGSARPLFPFNTMFGGDQAQGTWSLIVYDQFGQDTGEFIDAELCFGPATDANPTNGQRVNLAAIAEINVTLNDDCEALVIPEMVLTGDFDDDDDGESVGGENFEVVVLDDDPTNGGIIDGCGTFTYRVSAREPGFTITQGFSDDFDPDGANVVQTIGEDASATIEGDRLTLTSEGTGNTDDGGVADDAQVDVTFVDPGFVSFVYDVDIDNSGATPDIAVVNFEGEILYFLPNIVPNQGSLIDRGRIRDIEVEPGNTLSFILSGSDEATQRESIMIIDDFIFVQRPDGPPVEVLNFSMAWGVVNAEDKTPPELVETPMSINSLLCSDVDNNNVNMLDASVSRCYLVNSVTGATIPGSMDPELRSMLSPGAFDADDSDDPAMVPTFFDGCAKTLQVCVSDVVENSDDGCGATVITRTFTAGLDPDGDGCEPLNEDEEDIAATTVSTSFLLTFLRPSIDSLNASNIQPVVEIEACGSLTSPLEFLPTEEDYPFLTFGDRTLSLLGTNNMCSQIAVTFATSENPIMTCPNTVKFQRTFTVVDWCDATNVQTFSQFVKIGDTTGPDVTTPSAEGGLTFGTNVAGECAAVVRLDAPGLAALDVCSGTNVDLSVTIYPDGDVTQGGFGAYPILMNNGVAELSDPLEVGDYSFVYTATDECGNQTVTSVAFQVVDGSTPEAICEDGLNIGLSRPSGLAVVTPEEINAGSKDDCTAPEDLIYQIGRSSGIDVMPDEFGDQVVFTCEDLGTQYLTLQVLDDSGLESNVNTCWLEVLVEIKNGEAPTCIAPGAVTLTCDQFNAALPAGNLEESTNEELDAAFGVATSVGVCGATTTSEIIVNNLNECGVGTAVRQYTSTDPSGATNTNLCTQAITIVGVYDYQIVLPGNATSFECTGEFDTDEVQVNGGACDMVVVDAVTDEVFGDDDSDACYLVNTTYTITNMCEVDMAAFGSTPITREGLDVEDTDPIYVNVMSMNDFNEGDDVAFLSSSPNREFTPDDDDDDEIGGYAASAGRGRFTYVQSVAVFDRVAPIVEATAPADCFSGCTADLSLDFVASDDCLEPSITLALDANYNAAAGFSGEIIDGVAVTLDDSDSGNGNYTINATGVPAGDHAILITATDGCGNPTSVIVEVSVCGDVAPTPVCVQTVVAVLADDGMGGGTAEVAATAFQPEGTALLDCFGNEITKFGIVREGEGPASVDMVSVTVTCSDFGDFVPVEVYAFDDAGNEPEFCTVMIEVQEGDGVTCGGGGNIAGRIATNGDDAMGNVQVTLTGSNDMDQMQMTDEAGRFDFLRLPYGGDYTLTPAYAEPVNLQRVKISDVVAISNVILGSNQFESVYDYLAADVDQNRRLNVLDMVAIQRVILGLDNTFATDESWGFVPAETAITDPYAAAFPRVYNANDVEANILDADFVAFEYGNVTGEGRTALNVSTADAELAAGQTHTLIIKAADLAGYQGTFELAAGLELIGADYDGQGALNLDYAAEGLVAVAVMGTEALELTVRATEAGRLSDLISLTDAITIREGVSGNGASGSLNLEFSALADAGDRFNSLGEATPNPVVESTRISYTLAADSDVTLTVQDVQGRAIMVRKTRGTAGANAEVVNVSELNGVTGVLTYTITAGDFSATKKLVVVR